MIQSFQKSAIIQDKLSRVTSSDNYNDSTNLQGATALSFLKNPRDSIVKVHDTENDLKELDMT